MRGGVGAFSEDGHGRARDAERLEVGCDEGREGGKVGEDEVVELVRGEGSGVRVEDLEELS